MTRTTIDWAAWTAPAAIRLLGEPTDKTETELRFRSRGSFVVQTKGTKRGTWFDHEAGEGGGCLDLIRREQGVDKAGAIQWLRDELRAEIADDKPGKPTGCTLARYAEAKRLPCGFLEGLGLRDCDWFGVPAVKIPYGNPDGSEAAVRYRVGLEGDRFRWARGAKKCLYGLNQIEDARSAGFVVVCEGESDVHVLRFQGIPAVGVPGAAAWDEDRDAGQLDGVREIFVIVEPGKGGETFRRKLAASRLAPAMRFLSLDGAKDPAELFRKDSVGFKAKFHAALAGAKPLSPAELAAARATAATRAELQEEVRRLAALDPLEYERAREAAATSLGVRVSALDAEVKRARPDRGEADKGQGRALILPEPEPWPEPVDGALLLDGLDAELRRYLALPKHAAETCALWAVHTHVYDAGQVTPRLAITSPEKRCGKTTLLTIMARLAARPLPAANVTAAAVFRTIEKARPTLLIDEADTFIGNSDELRGVLNSGHTKASAYVVRTCGDDHDPRQFSTWAPVALAAIGKLPGTLQDRSIVIPMRRRAPDEPVERLRLDRCGDLDELARKVARWAADHQVDVARADPDAPAELHDRGADNWRPLLAIADLAGGEWPAKARAAAKALGGDDEAIEESARVQLLADLRDLFEEKKEKALWSGEICAALGAMEDRRWPEWKAGRPLTTRQLAALLKPFGISPRQVWKDNMNNRGYEREQFDDAFARYLSHQSASPLDASETAASSDSQSARTNHGLADQNGPNLNGSAGSSGQADQTASAAATDTTPGQCALCSCFDNPGDPVLPYGDADTGHAWLHQACMATVRENGMDVADLITREASA